MQRLNLNIGIMGHIDSGKTSLARVLSTTYSTASLDKHPQSQERGITLDLGFSSFTTPAPDHLKEQTGGALNEVQFTLVDCPGHASLIRTVIGGAQIIDMMMLVIDVTKGIQTQTAECLVVGEILMDELVVVLNKIDLIPDAEREDKIKRMKAQLQSKVFSTTKFKDCAMMPVSAHVGGVTKVGQAVKEGDDAARHGDGCEEVKSEGIDELVAEILSRARVPERREDAPFYFAIDHCFPVKGQGTVITGTVLSGSVSVNQQIELPDLKVTKKVKSMQMFRKPVNKAIQGDRVGLCIAQLDAKAIERGVAAEPSSVPTLTSCLIAVERVRFFKGFCKSKSKFHLTVGHTTVMATAIFFGPEDRQLGTAISESTDGLVNRSEGLETYSALHSTSFGLPTTFDFDKDYTQYDDLPHTDKEHPKGSAFAIVTLETPVACPRNAMLIGSHLDADVHHGKVSNSCRLSFYGQVLMDLDLLDKPAMERIRIVKYKERIGQVRRAHEEDVLIGKGMFKKETDISSFFNLKVQVEGGPMGYIEGTFGSSGQFKVRCNAPHGIPMEKKKKKDKKEKDKKEKDKKEPTDEDGEEAEGSKKLPRLILRFKKYLFAQDRKKFVQ